MDHQTENLEEKALSDQPSAQPESRVRWSFVLDLLEMVVLALLIFFGINAISSRIRVDGSSMEPTLHSGELVIVSKVHYWFQEPQRKDVVFFHLPQDPDQDYIKRVIGVPGDRIDIADGQVRVNGQVLDEPYLAYPTLYSGSWVIPPGSLFVLGDNRNNSSDSHEWGPVPLDYVVGKALLVYWPPDAWRLIASR